MTNSQQLAREILRTSSKARAQQQQQQQQQRSHEWKFCEKLYVQELAAVVWHWQRKSCEASQGRAGNGRANLQQGRAGQAGQTERAGQGRAGQGRAGQGRAGQGRAGQGKSNGTWKVPIWVLDISSRADSKTSLTGILSTLAFSHST